MKGELLKGNLDMLLLNVVAERPSHGYAIIEELRRRSSGAFDLPEGTVYPALHRLEAAGLVSSRWSDAGGRRRRVYDIRRKGREALRASRDEWSAFARAVRSVMAEGA